jgi:hypothetical protein
VEGALFRGEEDWKWKKWSVSDDVAMPQGLLRFTDVDNLSGLSACSDVARVGNKMSGSAPACDHPISIVRFLTLFCCLLLA